MKTHLKMKICSLAAEAQIIRREEKKWPGKHAMRQSLRDHRLDVVRKETRCSLLAYGFLRGRLYKQVENSVRLVEPQHGPTVAKPIDWDRVAALVAKYGPLDKRDAAQQLAEWAEYQPLVWSQISGMRSMELAGLTLETVERDYKAMRPSFSHPADLKYAYARVKLGLRPPREKLPPEEARRRHEATLPPGEAQRRHEARQAAKS